MIGVNVRVDDMRNLHSLRVGESDVLVDVLPVGIDDRAFAERSTAQEISRTAGRGIVVGFENHRTSSPTATRRPRDRSSTMPASSRVARYPFLLRRSTAWTAITQKGPRQYATTSRRFGNSRSRFLSSGNGMEIAPAM